MAQPVANIGTVGHVDHGKTTITYMLSGKWPDTHSEEVKRGITIKLGYADVTFYKCGACGTFGTKPKCEKCGGEAKETRKISLVDSPGHETLMATVVAASSIMDGAIFVIAANEKCPQPQTQEHLMVLEAAGVRNVVIAQNKVDLVSREQALEHYRQIKDFLKGSSYENAPVIPLAANTSLNESALIQAIEESIPTPERRNDAPPKFLVARSFDVNKPGTDYKRLVGGVIGGSLVEGKIVEGAEVEVLPGALHQTKKKESYEPIQTRILSLHSGGSRIPEAVPGGLVGLSTGLDPSLTKADSLVGCLLGLRGSLPPVWNELAIEVTVLSRLIESFPPSYQSSEPLVVCVGTATTVGFVSQEKKAKKGVLHLTLKKPVCANKGDKIAVMRRSRNRWRLYATGKIV